jgi:hypothetical protein
MDKYRKFYAETTALLLEIAKSAQPTSDDRVAVDARLIKAALGMAITAKGSSNLQMEHQLAEAGRRVRARFGLPEGNTLMEVLKDVAADDGVVDALIEEAPET